MGKFRKALCICIISALLVACLGTAAAAATTNAVTAKPTTSSVRVNGKEISFTAYNIQGNNFFKLRDLAMALNGTAKQFEIGYDSQTRAITITSGSAYTAVGGELTSTGETAAKQATPSKSTVYIDAKAVDLTAYTINGNNYFKLRDVGAAIDFGVTYNNETRAIGIYTYMGYDDVNPLIGAWQFSGTTQGVAFHLYLIFSEDGSVVRIRGCKIATYTADDDYIYVTLNSDTAARKSSYQINAAEGQTTLTVDEFILGKMTRDGETTKTGPEVIKGLWVSQNSIYTDRNVSDVYFYFSDSSNIILGPGDFSNYTISGSTFSDTITSDGSFKTSSFEITEVNGVTTLTMQDSSGNETVLTKE